MSMVTLSLATLLSGTNSSKAWVKLLSGSAPWTSSAFAVPHSPQ